jgi:hypothetical protein
MADVQTYKNHVRWLPPFHFFAFPVLLINALYELWRLVQAPAYGTAWAAVVAAALVVTCFLARYEALLAQDRVIRLEMRLRLARTLPADLQARVNDISVRQLVGLRFASDGELPELVRTVLKDNTKESDIKKMIKVWEPDTYRV